MRVRRYSITENGKLLDEQRKFEEELERRKFFVMPSISAPWPNIPPEEAEQLRVSIQRLIRGFLELRKSLKFSKDVLKETIKILEETAEKIEKIDFLYLGAFPAVLTALGIVLSLRYLAK